MNKTTITPAIKAYITTHKKRFLNELMDLLRIPSISTKQKFVQEVRKAAEFTKNKLLAAGADKAELLETAGHPLVYGEKMIDQNLPTILVYGHYDVQPADPYELWDTPPFEPTIRNEKIYARGACDDKGQMYIHVKALETMLATHQLPCNVKFLIEGEEEMGCLNIMRFLDDKKNHDLLKSDIVLVSDTGLLSIDQPALPIGLRGIIYFDVEVISANRDLHSGMYGGAVANPIHVLAQMIAALKDKNNHITLPGFYSKVETLTATERAEINTAPFDLAAYKKAIDIAEVAGEKGYTTLERIGIRPSLDVNGIWGGYIEDGAKTVLPAKAHAKISMRLVPQQSAQEIIALFQKHFTAMAPKNVKIKITPHAGGNDPILFNAHTQAMQAGINALEEVWGKRHICTREGGSIPVVAKFKEALGIDTVLMGFGLDTDAIHSPNENFGIYNFFKGIEATIAFYHHYTRLYQ